MRLIDADTLVKGLSYLYTKNHIPVDMRTKEILTTIMEQPTAYDIDKVVEELEKIEQHCLDMSDWQGQSAICDAIEIVKQGGVSDDVCEWKIKDKVIYASCNNKQIASAFCWFNECGDYKYCPYCGKKINVM